MSVRDFDDDDECYFWETSYIPPEVGPDPLDAIDDLARSKVEEQTDAEIQRQELTKRHRSFLEKKGILYEGVSPLTGKTVHRTPNCYACKGPLDNKIDIECKTCRWILCACGACGCGYEGHK